MNPGMYYYDTSEKGTKMEPVKYNENITILRVVKDYTEAVTECHPLMEKNEKLFFAYMIEFRGNSTNYVEFFDREKKWIGLEQTGMGHVYISKKFAEMDKGCRGFAVLVEVEHPLLCCYLA